MNVLDGLNPSFDALVAVIAPDGLVPAAEDEAAEDEVVEDDDEDEEEEAPTPTKEELDKVFAFFIARNKPIVVAEMQGVIHMVESYHQAQARRGVCDSVEPSVRGISGAGGGGKGA